MTETGVHGTGINHVRESQLLDTQQSLEIRMCHYVVQEFVVEGNESVDGIVDNFCLVHACLDKVSGEYYRKEMYRFFRIVAYAVEISVGSENHVTGMQHFGTFVVGNDGLTVEEVVYFRIVGMGMFGNHASGSEFDVGTHFQSVARFFGIEQELFHYASLDVSRIFNCEMLHFVFSAYHTDCISDY